MRFVFDFSMNQSFFNPISNQLKLTFSQSFQIGDGYPETELIGKVTELASFVCLWRDKPTEILQFRIQICIQN